MRTESKLWHLEQINIFKDLSEDEMLEIDKISKLRELDKKANIYFPKDPSNVVYLLKSGRVKLTNVGEDGKEIIKAIIYPGEIFGELALAGENKRTDNAIALDKDVKICIISIEEMEKMIQKIPRLAFKITRVIGERTIELERKYSGLVSRSSEERILYFLSELVNKIGQEIGLEILIKHNLTQKDIAGLTATSRQTVNAVFNDLKRKGVANFQRDRIIIHEPQLLPKL